jgi:hypothetical protein
VASFAVGVDGQFFLASSVSVSMFPVAFNAVFRQHKARRAWSADKANQPRQNKSLFVQHKGREDGEKEMPKLAFFFKPDRIQPGSDQSRSNHSLYFVDQGAAGQARRL